jgi:hypothetical protein
MPDFFWILLAIPIAIALFIFACLLAIALVCALIAIGAVLLIKFLDWLECA